MYVYGALFFLGYCKRIDIVKFIFLIWYFSFQVQYQYPARIAANEQLPKYILDRLQDGQLLLSVQFDTAMQVILSSSLVLTEDSNLCASVRIWYRI